MNRLAALAVASLLVAFTASAPAAPPQKALTEKQQAELLGVRLNGTLGNTFSQFANMFVVRSAQALGGRVIGLATATPEIAKTELQPAFPPSYQPTLRELLDQVALETGSTWAFNFTGKFIDDKAKDPKPDSTVVIVEFKPAKRARPYTVTMAPGWKSADRGHWTQYRPPTFPVGLDIYELGSYSPEKGETEADFLKRMREEISLQWAQLPKPDAQMSECSPVKVGGLEALHFTTMMHPPEGPAMRWRQWVFLDGRRAYFIVSTILEAKDAELYPDVKAMVESFKIEPAPAVPKKK